MALNGKVYCTVNSDASFCPKTLTGGYGIWIRCEEYTKKYSGQFKGEVTDSNECEIKAVINALYLLIQEEIEFDILVVNCDNQVVRGIVNDFRVPHRFKVEGKILLELLKQFNKTFYAKHIKGHQKNNQSARQYINNWVDGESRKYKNG